MNTRKMMERVAKAMSKVFVLMVSGVVLGMAWVKDASATSAGWTGSAGNGNWNDNGNWTAAYPNSTSDIATFSNAASPAVSLNGANRTVSQVLFDKAIGSCTINASGSEKLVLPAASGTISLPNTTTGTGLIETFNCGISLGNNITFSNAKADPLSSLVFNGSITNSGTFTLTLSGAGTGTNRIMGAIVDGGGVQSITTSFTAGAWELGGANTFSGALSKGGGGIFILSGSNSSAGATTLSAGTLVLASSANGGLASGTFSMSGTTTLRSDGATTRTLSNALDFSAGTLTFGNATANGDLVLKGNGTLTGTPTLSPVATLALEGALSGASGFGRVGTSASGVLFLSGNNSYSGVVQLGDNSGSGGGTVINSVANAGSNCALGTGGVINMFVSGAVNSGASSVLRYVGGSGSSDRVLAFNGTTVGTPNPINVKLDASGTGALTWNGNVAIADSGTTGHKFMLDGINTGLNTFSGILTNGSASGTALVKAGSGTWVVNGVNAFTNGIQANGGTLILDYVSNPTVVAVNNLLTLGGGTLQLKGKNSGSSAQTLGLLTATTSTGMGTVSLSKNGGSGVALTLGAFTGSPNLYSIFFDLGSDLANSVTLGDALTIPNVRYLLKDGSSRFDWVKNSGANTAISALASITDLAANPGANDYRLTGDLTVTANSSLARTVRIDPTADNKTLTLTQGTSTANNRFSAIMLVGGYNFTINQTAGQTGGFGDGTGASSKALIYHFGTGKLTVNARLAGDSSGSGTGTVEFYGTGLIDWTKAPNSSGNVLVSGVTLRQSGSTGQLLSNTGSGLGSGNILLAQNGVLEVSDATDITRNVGTGAGALQWVGDGGFSAFGGGRAVKLNNGTASITWGSASFVGLNNTLILSAPNSDSTIDFQNGLNFANGQRVVRVDDGSATVDAKLSGVLSGGYGSGLIKRGAGTLELTGANTYSGDTWVEAGTLRVSGTAGNGIVTVSSGASVSGTGTVNRLTLNSGGKLVVYDTGSGVGSKLNVTGAMNISNGTLDLSSLPTPVDGDLTVANCGSIVGSSFSSVVGLPANREVQVVNNTIVLKDTTAQGFMLIVR